MGTYNRFSIRNSGVGSFPVGSVLLRPSKMSSSPSRSGRNAVDIMLSRQEAVEKETHAPDGGTAVSRRPGLGRRLDRQRTQFGPVHTPGRRRRGGARGPEGSVVADKGAQIATGRQASRTGTVPQIQGRLSTKATS